METSTESDERNFNNAYFPITSRFFLCFEFDLFFFTLDVLYL